MAGGWGVPCVRPHDPYFYFLDNLTELPNITAANLHPSPKHPPKHHLHACTPALVNLSCRIIPPKCPIGLRYTYPNPYHRPR